MTSSKDEADKIFKAFNEANAHIKFEIEHPSSGTAGTNKIALLDFQIEIDDCGDQTFSFYKKGAKGPLFPHFRSAISFASKVACIKNEIQRISERCTKSDERSAHLREFRTVLAKNGYPAHTITTITEAKKIQRRREEIRDFAYFNLPFLNDNIQRRVAKAFRDHDLPVRVFSRSRTMKNALQKAKEPMECTLKIVL